MYCISKDLIYNTNTVISTEKKPKGPLAKLFKGKSKGFTLTAEVKGMDLLFY